MHANTSVLSPDAAGAEAAAAPFSAPLSGDACAAAPLASGAGGCWADGAGAAALEEAAGVGGA